MTDSFKVFLERWSAPSVLISLLMIVVGGIIWGVQINALLTKLVELHGAQGVRIEKLENENYQGAIDMTKTSLILDRILERLDATEKAVAEHNKEAEGWKRKILLNERAISEIER